MHVFGIKSGWNIM